MRSLPVTFAYPSIRLSGYMARAKQTNPRALLVEGDQPHLGTIRRFVVVVMATLVNLVGWIVGRLTLLDDWAYCDQFSDGCESHMLALPALVALWLSMLIGAVAVFGMAILLSKVRLVPTWFPRRLVFPLGILPRGADRCDGAPGNTRSGPTGTRIPSRSSSRSPISSGR